MVSRRADLNQGPQNSKTCALATAPHVRRKDCARNALKCAVFCSPGSTCVNGSTKTLSFSFFFSIALTMSTFPFPTDFSKMSNVWRNYRLIKKINNQLTLKSVFTSFGGFSHFSLWNSDFFWLGLWWFELEFRASESRNWMMRNEFIRWLFWSWKSIKPINFPKVNKSITHQIQSMMICN